MNRILKNQYMLSYCTSGRIKSYALKTILHEGATLSEEKGIGQLHHNKRVFALKSNS